MIGQLCRVEKGAAFKHLSLAKAFPSLSMLIFQQSCYNVYIQNLDPTTKVPAPFVVVVVATFNQCSLFSDSSETTVASAVVMHKLFEMRNAVVLKTTKIKTPRL